MIQDLSIFTIPAKDALWMGIKEDGWPWDFTTLLSISNKKAPVRSKIISKSAGIWAGSRFLEALPLLASELGEKIKILSTTPDGSLLKKGQKIAEWECAASLAFTLERPFLNLAAYTSGIATQTHELVREVEKTRKKLKQKSPAPRVTATRKTLPHLKNLTLYGVLAGGGHCHRLNLSNGILIKENHIAVAGGSEVVLRESIQNAPHLFGVGVEVKNLIELQAALNLKAHVVLLDNFSPSAVKRALALIKKQQQDLIVEVSGGIRKENISKYVLEGVHIISSGSLTHSVQSLDFSLLMEPIAR